MTLYMYSGRTNIGGWLVAKYNIFEELMNVLRDEVVKVFSQERVGNKFVTHFEVPKSGVLEDRVSIDLLQDNAGNLIGLRTEAFSKNGEKLQTVKMTPSVKSETYTCSDGTRYTRFYDGRYFPDKQAILYNPEGTKPMSI